MPAAVIALLVSAGPAPAATPEETAAICEEAARRYQEQFGSAQASSPEPVVAMYKHTFCPRRLTVKQGAAVKFVNVDKRTSHSFWFRDAGKPESERFLPGEGATMTIDLPPGEHSYLCGPHWEREDMTGSLTVTP
jgi:plastocyanin